ncbi:MAG: polysaccharide deacetylase, partial [Alphaproteobacteria bacterium]|nr:polysaccharide deacetylase [Alphaproteobacteria bacterium]
PYRLRYLRRALQHVAAHRDGVWITTAGAIAAHAAALPAGMVPGG